MPIAFPIRVSSSKQGLTKTLFCFFSSHQVPPISGNAPGLIIAQAGLSIPRMQRSVGCVVVGCMLFHFYMQLNKSGSALTDSPNGTQHSH